MRNGFLSAVCHLLGGLLSQASGPSGASVSTGATTATAAATGVTGKVAATTSGVTTSVTFVVADDVAAAVVRVRYHLVGHVLLVTAKQFLQSDYGGDYQSDFTDQKSLSGDQSDESKGQWQKCCHLQGDRHEDWSQDLGGLLCKINVSFFPHLYWKVTAIKAKTTHGRRKDTFV